MRKKESSNLDLLRFFPVWGKSVMDSIKKSMEDKTNSEEQVVTINMEDNNENSMDGGRGKRRRKKVSHKKKEDMMKMKMKVSHGLNEMKKKE